MRNDTGEPGVPLFRPFVCLQSASGRFRFLKPPSGTTCLSRFSDNETRDLSVFPFLPRHYHMTRVLLLPLITTVWTHVVLATINIILATSVLMVMMIMMMMKKIS